MVKKRNGRNDSRSTCYLRCVQVEVEVEVEKEEEEEDEEKEKKERKISTTCFLRWCNRREGHVEMYALYAPYEEQSPSLLRFRLVSSGVHVPFLRNDQNVGRYTSIQIFARTRMIFHDETVKKLSREISLETRIP